MIARFEDTRRPLISPPPPAPGGSRAVSAQAATLGLIAAGALIRLWAASFAGLCYGESYYFSCARHPSLSYFDQPPLSILLATASMYLTGHVGPLVLRAPFIAMFAGTTWLLFALGRRLFGPWPGFYAALLMNLAPIFSLSVAIFLQPDGPLMFFWLACVSCLVRVLLDPAPRHALGWWAAAGALLGLGLLSKYQAVFLVPGVALYLLRRPDQRRWLAHPGPYLALGIAALLFLPVLVWNAQHHWISFIWQSTRGLDDPRGLSLEPTRVLANIAGQALELLPWVWLALVVELVRSFRRTAPPARQLLAWLAVGPIVLFTAVAVYAPLARTHFHWGMPGYLLLFLPLGDTVDRWIRQGLAIGRWGLAATAGVSILGMTLVTAHEATGFLKDGPAWLARAVAEDRDPTYECIDYTGLDAAFAERGLLDRKDIFVFSDWWYRAGKVDYGLRGKLPVLALNRNDPRNFAFLDSTERWLGKDGILVSTNASLAAVSDYYAEFFERAVPLGSVELGRRGRHEVTLYLYRFEKLRRPYPLPYG
ncbi:MAG TPA: glycosyltransferase family 39 protein [Candidatus Methylomirabilis sp.]|nr:glycosyltransferase family 39 protein [Candidatus Methylomirabilis sp.]